MFFWFLSCFNILTILSSMHVVVQVVRTVQYNRSHWVESAPGRSAGGRREPTVRDFQLVRVNHWPCKKKMRHFECDVMWRDTTVSKKLQMCNVQTDIVSRNFETSLRNLYLTTGTPFISHPRYVSPLSPIHPSTIWSSISWPLSLHKCTFTTFCSVFQKCLRAFSLCNICSLVLGTALSCRKYPRLVSCRETLCIVFVRVGMSDSLPLHSRRTE